MTFEKIAPEAGQNLGREEKTLMNNRQHTGSRHTAQAPVNLFAEGITRAWHRQRDAVFETGRLLIEAKAALRHGSFIAMVERELPFKRRTAEMLMAIADDPRLSNAQHVALLPTSYGTLYDLTRLPDEAFAAAIADGTIHPEMQRKDVHGYTTSDDWRTPPETVEPVRQALGDIDLDPCTSSVANQTVAAAVYFTAEDDGLAQEWPTGRIFLNPPYSRIAEFTHRFCIEVGRASVGIALVHSGTATPWFQELAASAAAICFPSRRIPFLASNGNKPSSGPPQAQAVVYCGGDVAGFRAAFGTIGVIGEGWA